MYQIDSEEKERIDFVKRKCVLLIPSQSPFPLDHVFLDFRAYWQFICNGSILLLHSNHTCGAAYDYSLSVWQQDAKCAYTQDSTTNQFLDQIVR